MRDMIFSGECACAAQWTWTAAPRQSTADMMSDWCVRQCAGDAQRAFVQAQHWSAKIQNAVGVERAWACMPGVVFVVLESATLLQLALDSEVAPWEDEVSRRWLLDYAALSSFDDVTLTHARQGLVGDTLARALVHAGHRVVRERLVLDDEANLALLGDPVQKAMRAMEEANEEAFPLVQWRRTPSHRLVQDLAQKALRLGVQSCNAQGIRRFAGTVVMAQQEESLSGVRVEFDRLLQSSAWVHGNAFAATDLVHQQGEGFDRIVHVRGSGHERYASSFQESQRVVQPEASSFACVMVQPVRDVGIKRLSKKHPATLHAATQLLGVNEFRMGLLQSPLHRVVRMDEAHWVERVQHQGRSMHEAFIKAHAAVEEHCQGVAAMEPGIVAHAAKPLLLTLLKWPGCHRRAVETLNPAVVANHAMELVRRVHKTYAYVPMGELDGKNLDTMGTLWSLTASQLRVVFDILGLDILQWADQGTVTRHTSSA